MVGKSRVTKMSLCASGTPSKAPAWPLAKINDFFAIVEQIRAVDTTGVEPLPHPVDALAGTDIALRLRPDVASEPNQREANQRSAPAVERGLFLVPKVIE